MFIRNLISQLLTVYEIDFDTFIKSRTEEVTTIRYAVITAMCDYFTDIEISKSTKLCRSAVNKIRNAYVRRFKRWSERQMLDEVRKIIVAVIGE